MYFAIMFQYPKMVIICLCEVNIQGRTEILKRGGERVLRKNSFIFQTGVGVQNRRPPLRTPM